MSKTKKKAIIILCAAVFVSGAIFGAIRIPEHIERAAVRRIEDAYWRVNNIANLPHIWMFRPEYHPLPDRANRWGINPHIYTFLNFYERETGNTIPYETVTDYFSQEFEPDGSLRLYNNGNHPEMQALVEWLFYELRIWMPYFDYLSRIQDIYNEYVQANEDAGFVANHPYHWLQLSPQMFDALARAEADPDYVLDLTSLQKAGY